MGTHLNIRWTMFSCVGSPTYMNLLNIQILYFGARTSGSCITLPLPEHSLGVRPYAKLHRDYFIQIL